jgi:hypothetical protein
MSFLLYIGDRLVDTGGASIAYFLNRFDVGDITARFIDSTNQFTVPYTEANEITFGYSNSEHTRSVKGYRVHDGKISDNGFEKKVKVIVKRADKGFRLQVTDISFGLFNAISGLRLSEINAITPDTPWTEEEMDTYRTATDGLVSPILDWGTAPATIFNSNLYLPCFYYHSLVKAVLQYTGLSLSGNILTDSRFTDLVIPFPSSQFTKLNAVDSPAYIDKGAFGATTGSSFNVSYPNNIEESDILFLHVSSYGLGTITVDASWTSLGSLAEPSGTPVFVSKLYWKLADGTETGPENVSRSGHAGTDVFMGQIYQYRGDADWADVNISIEDSDNGSGNSATITWQATSVAAGKRTLAAFVVNMGANPGSPASYSLSATDNDGSNNYLELNTKEDVSSGASVTATGGSATGWITWHVSIYNQKQDVDWNQYLNEIRCDELIKDFFVRFGIIPREKHGVLYLKTLEEIISDRTNFTDWSAKLTKNERPIDMASRFYQVNEFSYSDSDQVKNPSLGMGTFNVDDLTLKASGKYFQTFFENCITENITGYNVGKIPLFDADSLSTQDINGYSGIKILTLASRTVEPSITFDQTARTDYKIAYFVNSLLAKDTGFQYFLDQFYPLMVAALQRFKLVKKTYVLNEIDVLDFNIHKMIWDGEGYYIIPQIGNFTGEGEQEVTLFKVG